MADYIPNAIVDEVIAKAIAKLVGIIHRVTIVKLRGLIDNPASIVEHTEKIFQVAIARPQLLIATYLSKDAARHAGKLTDTPPVQSNADFAVCGDIAWNAMVLYYLSKKLIITKATALVAYKEGYINNKIQGKFEELIGTDLLLIGVYGIDARNTKVLADSFEARIAYFWVVFGPGSKELDSIVEMIIIVMNAFHGLKRRQLDGFLEAYREGYFNDEVPLDRKIRYTSLISPAEIPFQNLSLHHRHVFVRTLDDVYPLLDIWSFSPLPHENFVVELRNRFQKCGLLLELHWGFNVASKADDRGLLWVSVWIKDVTGRKHTFGRVAHKTSIDLAKQLSAATVIYSDWFDNVEGELLAYLRASCTPRRPFDNSYGWSATLSVLLNEKGVTEDKPKRLVQTKESPRSVLIQDLGFSVDVVFHIAQLTIAKAQLDVTVVERTHRKAVEYALREACVVLVRDIRANGAADGSELNWIHTFELWDYHNDDDNDPASPLDEAMGLHDNATHASDDN